MPQMLSTLERRGEWMQAGGGSLIFGLRFGFRFCTSSSLNQAPNVIECLSWGCCCCCCCSFLGSVGMFTILRFWPQTKSTFLSVVEGEQREQGKQRAEIMLMMLWWWLQRNDRERERGSYCCCIVCLCPHSFPKIPNSVSLALSWLCGFPLALPCCVIEFRFMP